MLTTETFLNNGSWQCARDLPSQVRSLRSINLNRMPYRSDECMDGHNDSVKFVGPEIFEHEMNK